MEEIWRVTDRLGRVVSLTEDRLRHIRANHPDMERWLDDLPSAVAESDIVTRNPGFEHRVRHYRAIRGSRAYVRVVVHYRPTPEGWVGTIITAHRHPGPRSEVQLWP